jgi:hypothetical protein
MNDWKTSLYAQILYMFGMGAGLLLMPNFVLGTLGLEPDNGIWIRVLGLLALVFMLYYNQAIQNGLVAFARLSVWGRSIFCAGLAGLALYYGYNIILLLAAVEAVLAFWTWMTLPKTA